MSGSPQRIGRGRDQSHDPDQNARPLAFAADQPLPFPDDESGGGEPERQERKASDPGQPERQRHHGDPGGRAQREVGAEARARPDRRPALAAR